MQQWEYKMKRVSNYSAEKELNELGKQGWELVTLVTDFEGELHGEIAKFELDVGNVYAYLKRPISN